MHRVGRCLPIRRSSCCGPVSSPPFWLQTARPTHQSIHQQTFLQLQTNLFPFPMLVIPHWIHLQNLQFLLTDLPIISKTNKTSQPGLFVQFLDVSSRWCISQIHNAVAPKPLYASSCRCTGFRPILDAGKSFACTKTCSRDIKELCPSNAPSNPALPPCKPLLSWATTWLVVHSLSHCLLHPARRDGGQISKQAQFGS
jgi:hypothetical protein